MRPNTILRIAGAFLAIGVLVVVIYGPVRLQDSPREPNQIPTRGHKAGTPSRSGQKNGPALSVDSHVNSSQSSSTGETVIRTPHPDRIFALSDDVGLKISRTQRLPGGEALITLSAHPSSPKIKGLIRQTPGSIAGSQIVYHSLATPNDPIYPQSYSTRISLPAAWDITTGSTSVKIAVLDTGFALNHEDLTSQWSINPAESGSSKETNGLDDDANGKVDDWRGWDFVNNDNGPSTTVEGHGTEVAGLIGAATNNSKGVAGVDWNARIIPLQVLDDTGSGTTTDIIAALAYARSLGAKVMNMSFGSSESDPLLEAEINTGITNGINIVAGAGNCGDAATFILNGCTAQGQIIYPANYPGVLAVGSTDNADNRSSFSSYGPNLDVMAPGEGSIRTPTISGANVTTAYTTSVAGTSYSSPITAGVVALARAKFPLASPADITNYLTQYIDKPAGMAGDSRTNFYGYGRINAYKVLTSQSYSWQIVSQYSYTDETKTTPVDSTLLIPGQRVYVGFTAKNMGDVAWINSGSNPIRVGTTHSQDRVSTFCDNTWLSCNRPTGMVEASVAPGGTGTFEFWYKYGQAGAYREYFSLVAENFRWFNDPGLNFFTVAQQSIYSWSIVGQSSYTDSSETAFADSSSMNVGQSIYLVVTARNTGNITWTNSGANPTRLGTSNSQDRISPFCDSSWLSCNRPTTMTEASVAPGANATFGFWYKAPSTAGIYREHFKPVIDGLSWMNDTGLNFYTLVRFDTSGTSTTLTSNQTLSAGQSIVSSDGRYRLTMQGDGNLVLYSVNRPLWASNTAGTAATRTVMQSDGNLVLYDSSNKPYWASKTAGKGVSSLIMQSDGNLVIYDSANRPTWASNTHGQF